MNKGDTPPRSIQNEEEYLQEEADIKEVEEQLERWRNRNRVGRFGSGTGS